MSTWPPHLASWLATGLLGKYVHGCLLARILSTSARGWWLLWFLWIGVIVGVTTLPWSDFQGHSHWSSVSWLPFADLELSFSFFFDLLANIILFFPFGWMLVLARSQHPPISLRLVLLLAGVLSTSVELFQSFCHGRIASATDLFTNSLGAILGASVALRFRARISEELHDHV